MQHANYRMGPSAAYGSTKLQSIQTIQPYRHIILLRFTWMKLIRHHTVFC